MTKTAPKVESTDSERSLLQDDRAALGAILSATRDGAEQFLTTIADRPVAAERAKLRDERARLPELPERGWGATRALEFFRANLEPLLSASAGPRYLGFVVGGATPAALAGDWLAAAYDQNLATDGDSIATSVERHTIALLRELFGLPATFDGAFVTGGTQANLTCLATARQWVYAQKGIDVAEVGLAGAPPLALLGAAPHASIEKALSILGIGRASIVRVPGLGDRPVMDPKALDACLRARAGLPSIVSAGAGEVNTGDFDDLRAVAEIAHEHGAWLHVDGAFGLFAAVDPSRAKYVDGIELADSISADAHKWLNVPYDSGFVFTRHLAEMEKVFRATAAYLGAGPDLMHRTPENSRRFRALPAFMTLMAYGREGYREMVARCCEHASRLGAIVAKSEAFELLSEVRLNIVCFALRGRGGDGASQIAARDRVLARLRESGKTFLTPTTYGGRPGLRAAFSNWSTSDEDVAIVARSLEDAARGSS